MSENRDETTGQFTSAEPLYGLASVEQDAGYVHLPEENKEEPDGLTMEEAAERYSARLSSPDASIKTISPFSDLPDNLALTLEQAHKIKSDAKEADEAQAELEADEKLRKEVDELRGVDAAKETAAKAEASEIGKDPQADVERFLELPHVKEHVDRWNAETEVVRQTYSKATDIANDFARASFIENFPEISGLPLEHWEGALTVMAQREPDRFNKALNSLQRVVQLQTAQQQENQQRAFAERQQFEVYSKQQNAIFAEKTKDIPAKEMRAIEAEVPKMLQEYGASPAQFLEAIGTNTTFPRAAAEMLILDAAKYRMMKNAPKAVAAAKPIPAVQRPGVAPTKSDRAAVSLQDLSSKLAQSGSIEDAYKLYQAKQRRR